MASRIIRFWFAANNDCSPHAELGFVQEVIFVSIIESRRTTNPEQVSASEGITVYQIKRKSSRCRELCLA